MSGGVQTAQWLRALADPAEKLASIPSICIMGSGPPLTPEQHLRCL